MARPTLAGSALNHLSMAWLAAAVPYLLDFESLPAPWMTVLLSTYIGVVAGLVGPAFTTPRHHVRVADHSSTITADRVQSRVVAEKEAPLRTTTEYARTRNQFAHGQCPNCGGFDTDFDVERRECRICQFCWSNLGDPVEIRSWLHHT